MEGRGRSSGSDRYATSGPGGGPGFRDADLNHTYFVKRYQLYWEPPPTDFDNDLNFKIYRYGTVLMYLAEALTEMGQVAQAEVPLNELRARVGLAPVPAGMSQAQMRAWIDRELIMELAWEHKRVQYLKRHDLFNKATLMERNPLHGAVFVDGKSKSCRSRSVKST